ncbi:MAG: hypothetical protein ACYSTX_06425, partial [Planctomycetota bacterium]
MTIKVIELTLQNELKAVTDAMNGNLAPREDIEKKPREISKIYNPASKPPPLKISDISKEVNAIVDSEDFDDAEAEQQFRQMMKQFNSNDVEYGEPALERLGLQDYYPDINMPMQVGTYSGSIVGNNPIFVAGGGYIPMGIVDARKRALERAAANKVKQGQKLRELTLVPSAQQYQDKFNARGLEIFEKWGKAANWDYNKMLDPKEGMGFWKEYQEYRANANRTLKIQAQYDQLIKDLKENKHVPDWAKKAAEDWNAGIWESDMLADSKLLSKIEKSLRSYQNVATDGALLKDKIDSDVRPFGFIPDEDKGVDQDILNKELELLRKGSFGELLRYGKFTYVDANRIKELVETQVEYGNYFDKEQAKDDMFGYVSNLIADKVEAEYLKLQDQRNRTSVTINNAAQNANRTNEYRILASRPEFKKQIYEQINSPLYDNMELWGKLIRDNLKSEPKLVNGKFENNIVRAEVPLTSGQTKEFSYPAGQMKFDGRTLREEQERIIESRGMPKDMMKAIDDKKEGETWLQIQEDINAEALENYGIKLTPYETFILSSDDSFSFNAKWSDRSVVYKYAKPNSAEHTEYVTTMMSEPELDAAGTPVAYMEVEASLY